MDTIRGDVEIGGSRLARALWIEIEELQVDTKSFGVEARESLVD